jgi:hypothetical protein
MRKPQIVIAVVIILISAFAAVAMAADPSIGTWKLNITKSKAISGNVGAAPKERTLVKRELSAEQLEATFTGTGADGSRMSTKSIFPKEGGVVTYQQDSSNLATIMTVIAPGDCYVTYMRNGKQTQVEHWVVSEDGKTMLDTVIGSAQGKPFEAHLLWERQ